MTTQTTEMTAAEKTAKAREAWLARREAARLAANASYAALVEVQAEVRAHLAAGGQIDRDDDLGQRMTAAVNRAREDARVEGARTAPQIDALMREAREMMARARRA